MPLSLVKSALQPTEPPTDEVAARTDFDIVFPPLPRTVAEVSTLLGEQGDIPDTPRLVGIVESDPVVAAAVLRRCNSAYYGLRRRVGNIRQAVFLLGFPEVCNLVMASGLMKLDDVVTTGKQRRIFESIMRTSVGAAAFSQEISTHLDLPGKAKGFTVGLLHAVGRLVLLYNLPGAYEAIWPEGEEPPTAGRERLALGTDHRDAGARAAEHWNLPPFFGAVIQHHRTPDRLERPEERTMALVLCVAAAATDGLYADVPPPLERHDAFRVLVERERADLGTLLATLTSQRRRIRSYVEALVSA